MEYKKQKKIRKLLINYTNERIKYNKKYKKQNLLINSTTLDELEKKNLKCKEFFIQEKTQTYENINNNRSIVQNICINNNSFYSNIVIYPLSQRQIYNNTMGDFININDNILNNTYEEKDSENNFDKIIRQKTKKFLCSQKINNLESPVDQARLIKKELGERKLKRAKNKNDFDYNYNIYEVLNQGESLDKEKQEKDKDKEKDDNKNEFEKEKEKYLSKQLSTITLATEISRIIKVCHDENLSSFDHLNSESRVSEENEDIKKAKKYAKKLKFYCRTLKNKFPYKSKGKKFEEKINQININDKNYKNKDNNPNIDAGDYYAKDKDKKNNRKNKKVFKKIVSYGDKILQKRFRKKKNSEKIYDKNNLIDKLNDDSNNSDKENNFKYFHPNKKIKSERNIKLKIDRSTLINLDDHNLTEQSNSTYNQYNNQTTDNISKNKNKINSNYIKIDKKKKKISREENKLTFKTIKETIKQKSPFKKKKKELIKRIRNKLSDTFNENSYFIKKESKKILIKKKINNDDSQKLDSLFKKNKKNRVSIDTSINSGSLLETIFFESKNLSTTEEVDIIKKSKKNLNFENNQKNNDIINKQENIDSMNKKYKHINWKKIGEINKIENKQEIKEEKKKIVKLKKTKTGKTKKERNTYIFNEKNFIAKININNKRRLSPVINEEKIVKNKINFGLNVKNSKKIKKDDNKNLIIENSYTEETNDYNELDEYLYKKKHKKMKNNLK